MTFEPSHPSRRALLLGLVLSVTAAACGGSSSPTAPTPSTGTWVANVPFATTDINVGTGDEVVGGLTLSVDYVGWLYSTAAADNFGSQFDSSCPNNACTPIQFTVGAGRLIRGFEQGVLGMRVGGIRQVIIPPDLAYGTTGSGPIPPNATIIFQIRVNGIVVSAPA